MIEYLVAEPTKQELFDKRQETIQKLTEYARQHVIERRLKEAERELSTIKEEYGNEE